MEHTEIETMLPHDPTSLQGPKCPRTSQSSIVSATMSPFEPHAAPSEASALESDVLDVVATPVAELTGEQLIMYGKTLGFLMTSNNSPDIHSLRQRLQSGSLPHNHINWSLRTRQYLLKICPMENVAGSVTKAELVKALKELPIEEQHKLSGFSSCHSTSDVRNSSEIAEPDEACDEENKEGLKVKESTQNMESNRRDENEKCMNGQQNKESMSDEEDKENMSGQGGKGKRDEKISASEGRSQSAKGPLHVTFQLQWLTILLS